MNEIIKILSKVDGGNILDAATGKGDFINTLKQHLKSFTQIIGVDTSQRCVDYAQKIFPENNIEIYRMNLEDMQFIGWCVHFLFSPFLICHTAF